MSFTSAGSTACVQTYVQQLAYLICVEVHCGERVHSFYFRSNAFSETEVNQRTISTTYGSLYIRLFATKAD